MTNKELRQYIQEEVKKVLKEAAKPTLKVGKMYQVYDPGMDEWNKDYEYLGFDTNEQQYMFRASVGYGSQYHFVSIPTNDLKTDVKESAGLKEADTHYPWVRTKEYPELRKIVNSLTKEIVNKINAETKKVQSDMPYKAQWVLEELVNSLKDQI